MKPPQTSRTRRTLGRCVLYAGAISFLSQWPFTVPVWNLYGDEPWWAMLAWSQIPILLSALIDQRMLWQRRRDLCVYCLVVILCVLLRDDLWMRLMPAPHQQLLLLPLGMASLAGLPMLVEWIYGLIVRFYRRRLDPSSCNYCEYSLRGLDEPRCPECGLFFDPTVTMPRWVVRLTPRTWLAPALVALIIGMVLYPIANNAYAKRNAIALGREHAAQQIRTLNPTWYFMDTSSYGEGRGLTITVNNTGTMTGVGNAWGFQPIIDPATQMTLKEVRILSREDYLYTRTYQAVMADWLKQCGMESPSYTTYEHLENHGKHIIWYHID
jgi:hypothetical protein